MLKVVIFGSNGMLGHMIAEYLSCVGNYEVVRCARSSTIKDCVSLDIIDFNSVENFLCVQSPDVVVNCAGMLVKDSEKYFEKAIMVNGYFPNFLSNLGRKYSFKLIHISTDCVFSGAIGNYTEYSFRDNDTPYGVTKILGEVDNDRDLTLRTAIVGPEINKVGRSLLHWFFNQRGIVSGYVNVFWSGVTTLELSMVIDYCIKKDLFGVLNVTMKEKISKYDFLCLCSKIWELSNISVYPVYDIKWDRSLISDRKDFLYRLPNSYFDMLVGLKNFMNEYKEQYKYNFWGV